jgi:predicted phage tail protein
MDDLGLIIAYVLFMGILIVISAKAKMRKVGKTDSNDQISGTICDTVEDGRPLTLKDHKGIGSANISSTSPEAISKRVKSGR